MKIGHQGHFWDFGPKQQIPRQNTHIRLTLFAQYFFIIEDNCTILFSYHCNISLYMLALKKSVFHSYTGQANFKHHIQP